MSESKGLVVAIAPGNYLYTCCKNLTKFSTNDCCFHFVADTTNSILAKKKARNQHNNAMREKNSEYSVSNGPHGRCAGHLEALIARFNTQERQPAKRVRRLARKDKVKSVPPPKLQVGAQGMWVAKTGAAPARVVVSAIENSGKKLMLSSASDQKPVATVTWRRSNVYVPEDVKAKDWLAAKCSLSFA